MNFQALFLAPLAPYLAFEFETASGEGVIGSWSITPELHQPFGILHGGVHCAVVEGMASYGATLWYGDRGKVVGVSNTTDFYRAMSEGQVRSVARPLHQGRLQQVWVVETHDPDGRLVARGQVRLQNLPSRLRTDIRHQA